ncbi:hypothetical protein G3M48_001881 [Beauveria asiatica]|uniref:Uncharacterized protein n=1 Tax=Beauveria asiatica TaxID=1069075 RepID=A0AAW0RYI3_9HYPO
MRFPWTNSQSESCKQRHQASGSCNKCKIPRRDPWFTIAAGEEEPRPKDPENISGKPPPSDDDRVLNRGDLNRQIDAFDKYYKQANISFQLLDAD